MGGRKGGGDREMERCRGEKVEENAVDRMRGWIKGINCGLRREKEWVLMCVPMFIIICC